MVNLDDHQDLPIPISSATYRLCSVRRVCVWHPACLPVCEPSQWHLYLGKKKIFTVHHGFKWLIKNLDRPNCPLYLIISARKCWYSRRKQTHHRSNWFLHWKSLLTGAFGLSSLPLASQMFALQTEERTPSRYKPQVTIHKIFALSLRNYETLTSRMKSMWKRKRCLFRWVVDLPAYHNTVSQIEQLKRQVYVDSA